MASRITERDLERYGKELEVLLPAVQSLAEIEEQLKGGRQPSDIDAGLLHTIDLTRVKRLTKVIESLYEKGYAVFCRNDAGFKIGRADSEVLREWADFRLPDYDS